MLRFCFPKSIGRRSFSVTTSKSRLNREKPPPITITNGAAIRIKEMLDDKNDDSLVGVLIGVKRRGCNGYSYTMNYASKEQLESKKYEVAYGSTGFDKDVVVLVEPKAIFSIVGTEMDYEDTLLASEFTFNNPNAKGKCGCGESFNI